MAEFDWKYYMEEAKYEVKLAEQCAEYDDMVGYTRHITAAWGKFRIGTMTGNSSKELLSLINYEMSKRSLSEMEQEYK